MKAFLTEAEVASYQLDGFLPIEAFLDAEELDRWRSLTDEAVAARLSFQDELSNQGEPDSYYANVFTQVSSLWRLSAEMARLVLDPGMGEMAARLAGVDAVRLWNDQALYKQPHGNPTAWHLDAPYWSFDDRRAITLWIALDEASVENGCLWYLPGTQRTARFDALELGSNLDAMFDSYPEWRAIDSVPVELLPGGAVWHNGLVAHGAGANMTRRGRRAMTVAYMPDGVTYNGRRDEFVYSQDQAAKMKIGDRLDDAETNPLIWPASTIRSLGRRP